MAKGIPYIIALTGTPIVNRPIEAWNILQVLNRQLFPNFWEYAHRYCNARHNGFGWDFSGASNKDELHRKLTSTIMIRRKKVDVLADLPSKLYSIIPMEINNWEEYQRAERDFIHYVEETQGKDAARKASNAEYLTQIEALKQLAMRGKMSQVIDWVRDFLDSNNGNKIVLFAVHREVISTLKGEFGNIAVVVDGSTPTSQRQQAVESFQSDPNVRLFIGNIRAAGTGLTLTAASSVAFVELPWTPGELVQAEDRCHRIGQKDAVNVYYLLASNTIEEDIAKILDSKRTVLNTVLDGQETEQGQLLAELLEEVKRRKEEQ